MGGAVLCHLELRRPGTLRHVAAFEPPLFTRAAAALANSVSRCGWNWMANAVERRRANWPSREDARTHLGQRSAKHWQPAALEAFLQHGLSEVGDGRVYLACHPRTEARSLRSPGPPLPGLAREYTGSASFTILTGEASQFSPVGMPGTGAPYYRHALAPHLPGGGAVVRTIAGARATHEVAQEEPALLAQALEVDLRERGLLATTVDVS